MREMKGTMREVMGSVEHRRTRTHMFGSERLVYSPPIGESHQRSSRLAPCFSQRVGCRIRLIAG